MSTAEAKEDAFNLLCGNLIGRGMTRDVFECNIRKDCVIKVESVEVRCHFQNIQEWMVWGRVAGTEFEKWFAPVIEMAPNGRVLMMAKTDPLGLAELPKLMPAFFTDFKLQNFGRYKGHIVCHDYGSHLLMEEGLTKRMKKADWRHLQNS